MGTGPEFDQGSIETGRFVFRIRLQSPLCSCIFFVAQIRRAQG